MIKKGWIFGLAVFLWAAAAQARDFTIGLSSELGTLDPDLSRTMVSRVVYDALFDTLIGVNSDLKFVSRLATSWKWRSGGKVLELTLRKGVVFQDNTPFNAAAVKYNIERSKTLKGSYRSSELAPVQSVKIVDDHRVQLILEKPFVPLLAVLADRAGIMVSPTAAEKAGNDFTKHPIGTGAYAFESWTVQDRIVLKKFPQAWDAARYHFDRVIYRPIADDAVRLANVESGQLDLAERMTPTDIKALKQKGGFQIIEAPSLGFNSLYINMGQGVNKTPGPIGKDRQVREALEYSLDRKVIVDVVFAGQYAPVNQWVAANSPYFFSDLKAPAHDPRKAMSLLKAAGYDRVSFKLMVPNSPLSIQLGSVIQSMAKEGGFDITLEPVEFATALERNHQGDYDVFLIGWSGRLDPDGNIFAYYDRKGTFNENGYYNDLVIKNINEARIVSNVKKRKALYHAAMRQVLEDRPAIYLYNILWQWAAQKAIKGLKGSSLGILSLRDVEA